MIKIRLTERELFQLKSGLEKDLKTEHGSSMNAKTIKEILQKIEDGEKGD